MPSNRFLHRTNGNAQGQMLLLTFVFSSGTPHQNGTGCVSTSSFTRFDLGSDIDDLLCKNGFLDKVIVNARTSGCDVSGCRDVVVVTS